jgi:membrane protease YdiL (CAAX protease family)
MYMVATVDHLPLFYAINLPPPSIIDLFSHIFLTLFVTTLWVYVYRHRSFAFLAIAMFFPGVFALAIHFYHGSFLRFISFLLFHPQWSTFYWSIFGGLVPVVTVVICCIMNYLIGWGQFRTQYMTSLPVHEHNRNLLSGWLRAMGEEIGWRSYLLPGLLIHFHPIVALNISGLVWGLYHVPVMILLSYDSQSKVQYPIRTIIVQCLSCWISAFVYGWIGIQCQYSMVPPTMAHFIWNRINTLLLGSIYTNTPGSMTGEQWKINGEGLMGCTVYSIVAIVIAIQLW